MRNELVQPFLETLLKDLREAHKRWCSECVDDAEEMWQEYPDFIDRLIPQIENILDLPYSNLTIISATYGCELYVKDVKDIIEGHQNYNHIELRIDNHTMEGDPCPGQAKELTLTYAFKGLTQTIIILEGTVLKI